MTQFDTMGGGGYRRVGCGGRMGRLLIAAVIAIGGIIAYFMHTEVNPVTGEKQHIAMSVDQEKALGLQAAPQMAQEMGGAVDPKSDPDARKVAEIGNRIVQKSDARGSPYVDNFNYYLLNDSKTINAFALPGGQIFITRALYDRLQNEAQLAGVLGHETGHVINRHAAEHMAKGELGTALVTAVGVGASDDRGHGQMAAYAAAMANQMLQLKYSRTDELEADKYGLKYMAQAGFSPEAMLEVMRILKESAGSSGGSDIFKTHPDPDARIDQIRTYLKENYPNGVSKDLSMGAPLH
jgi:predicted Zn-dependent protease